MRKTMIYIFLIICVGIFFSLILLSGAVNIPARSVWNIIIGGESDSVWRYIVLEARLPMAITAALAGISLSVSGLMMQTTFQNPLAGPSILGVSSGASLGVALLTLASSVVPIFSNEGLLDNLPTLAGAIIGAGLVIALLLFFSSVVKSGLVLLIIGILISYLASAIISLLNFFAPAEDVKSFAVWGMGSMMGVTSNMIPLFSLLVLLLIVCSFLLTKPLNALLLGERYATNLGYSVRSIRTAILCVSGLLAAITTAYCGPIAFIGLIVPHLARLLFRTSNHTILIPSVILIGAAISLFCTWITILPLTGGVVPINAITPIIGVPVIVYILTAGRRLAYLN
jgi:iron complex transport system permease protein